MTDLSLDAAATCVVDTECVRNGMQSVLGCNLYGGV